MRRMRKEVLMFRFLRLVAKTGMGKNIEHYHRTIAFDALLGGGKCLVPLLDITSRQSADPAPDPPQPKTFWETSAYARRCVASPRTLDYDHSLFWTASATLVVYLPLSSAASRTQVTISHNIPPLFALTSSCCFTIPSLSVHRT